MSELSSEDCSRIMRIFLARQELIYKHAYRYLGDEQLIEDLMQDIAESFSRKYEDVSHLSEDSLCGYLFGIAKNKIYDILRRENHLCALKELENIPSPDNVEEIALGNIAAEEIFRHIGQLPPHYAFFIKMAYLDGLEPNLIAEILEVKPASLRMIAHRAKKLLAELCQKERTFE